MSDVVHLSETQSWPWDSQNADKRKNKGAQPLSSAKTFTAILLDSFTNYHKNIQIENTAVH